MTVKAKLRFASMPKDYAGLCRMLIPRPIRDRVDYANTCEICDAMAVHLEQFTTDQEDYFDLLCRLIEDYDSEHVSWPSTTPIGRLKFLMGQRGMTNADLCRVLGVSKGAVSLILSGSRQLTASHIRALAHHFAVGPELFI
jgi:antitoxin component HigA of HigAB toxin-antitoxin module